MCRVIAFQQTWNTIAKECTETYGPEDVGYVEVSPPQESIQGTQWWTSYQPVSYKLDSKLGTEAEFASMIKQCSAAGVNVIADVVLNQTTGSDVAKGEQAGVAGSKYNGSTGDYPGFATKQYPDGITAADFHSCDKNISNYTNQQEVQECRLSSMWDFNSESEKVQDIQSDYLVKLWNLGVRGFRMDAVKHIHTDSMKAIKEKFAKKIGQNANDIYWIQEVIGNSSEAAGIQPGNYVQNGTVTEFGFKSEMNQYFKDKVAKLKGLNERLSKDLPPRTPTCSSPTGTPPATRARSPTRTVRNISWPTRLCSPTITARRDCSPTTSGMTATMMTVRLAPPWLPCRTWI